VLHGDLGNQNVLLARAESGWNSLAFIDLNRAKIVRNPSLKQRAKDLQRIKLPLDYQGIFKKFYWQDQEMPVVFDHYTAKYRSRFVRKSKTSKWRHPVRYYKKRPKEIETRPVYPDDEKSWFWDAD